MDRPHTGRQLHKIEHKTSKYNYGSRESKWSPGSGGINRSENWKY